MTGEPSERGRGSFDFADLLDTLDLAVFEAKESKLEPVGSIPAWLGEVRPLRTWESGAWAHELPFLENFMVDARATWVDPGLRISSGRWTETGLDGMAWWLEAMALTSQGRKLLILERLKGEEDRQLLQTARESVLKREHLELTHQRVSLMLAKLERSHDDLLTVLDRLSLGTAMTDTEGRLTFVSKTVRTWLGKPKQEVPEENLIGRPWSDLIEGRSNELEGLRDAYLQEPSLRRRTLVRLETSEGLRTLEAEVQDDPRDSRRRILFFYDRTEVHRLREALKGRGRFHDLVGKSRGMQVVYNLIRDLAPYATTVLIEGETGTGKELVARALHNTSPRAEEAFIAVNCAGLTESLLNSQLFGHKRGSFTGAVDDHVGFIEAANGGTLFLDEIGDIPLDVQTRLLRVLQEREILRIGETHPRKVDVRIVAATHRNLQEEVDSGRFRSDLLYRIRVARIQLPVLQDRREDIPMLAQTFLNQLSAEIGKQVNGIETDAMSFIMDYEWPGNVRELRSAMEFGMIRCKGDLLCAHDLPPEILQLSGVDSPKEESSGERRRILAAMRSARGNRSQAAKLLGISRATFYRRLSRLEIPPKELGEN